MSAPSFPAMQDYLEWFSQIFGADTIVPTGQTGSLLYRIYEKAGPEILELKRMDRSLNFADWMIAQDRSFPDEPFERLFMKYKHEVQASRGLYQPASPNRCLEQLRQSGLMKDLPSFPEWILNNCLISEIPPIEQVRIGNRLEEDATRQNRYIGRLFDQYQKEMIRKGYFPDLEQAMTDLIHSRILQSAAGYCGQIQAKEKGSAE